MKYNFEADIDLLRDVVKDSSCFAEVFRHFGMTKCPTYYYTKLKIILGRHNIDYTHFDARINSNKTLIQNGKLKEVNIEDILSNNVWMNSNNVKRKLFSTGLKTRQCEECGLGDEWNGKPIVHHLDHIDGNNRNNALVNLRILCPNCHSQTDTYSRSKK